MEYWCPTGSHSFEINGASEGGVAANQRVNLFVREQAPHFGARIDQFLTGAPEQSFRWQMNSFLKQGGGMGFDGATTSRGLTGEFGLNFRPDVNSDCHSILLAVYGTAAPA